MQRRVGRATHTSIRVLHTNFHLGWGGQAARVFSLCKGLRDVGVDVAVAAPKGSVLAEKCSNAGIRALGDVRFSKGFHPADFWQDVRSIKGFIVANRINILHTHGSQDTWSGSVAAARCPRRWRPAVVRTRHNTFPVKYSLVNRFLYRWLIDRLIIVSDSVMERYARFIESGVIMRERVSTIHSCIEVGRFDPEQINKKETRDALDIPCDAPVIVAAARLAREKGHRFLLQAVASLRSEFPNVLVLLAGEGSQEETLKAQTRELDLSDNVRFLGFCEHVPKILAAADVSVLPSIDCDASSASIKEAMAMQVPVVATSIGGAAEIIDHEADGLIVQAGDASALAGAITRLLKDPALRSKMGRAGRSKVIKRFTEQKLASDTMAVYREMLEPEFVGAIHESSFA